MVARLTAQKAPQHFLDVATTMQQAHKNLRFLWVGDGDFAQQWDQTVAQRGLERAVMRVGWQDEVQPWLAATDAYLHTAAYEGLPLSILEALGFWPANIPHCTDGGRGSCFQHRRRST